MNIDNPEDMRDAFYSGMVAGACLFGFVVVLVIVVLRAL